MTIGLPRLIAVLACATTLSLGFGVGSARAIAPPRPVPVIGALAGTPSVRSLPLPVSAPKAPAQKTFTIAMVPDTQNETQFAPAMELEQWGWLANNQTALNLQGIVQVGDVVNTKSDPSQWANARAAFSLPSVVETIGDGNHDSEDYTSGSWMLNPGTNVDDGTDFTNFIESLPVSTTAIAGRYETGSDLNYYQERTIGATRYIFISLQFGAPAGPTSWAAQVASDNPTAKIIIETHDFLDQHSHVQNRGDQNAAPRYNASLQSPDQIWHALMAQRNIEFILSGHIGVPTPGLKWGTGKATLTGTYGNKVHAIMLNAEDDKNGDGWLRLLTFVPSKGEVRVDTYSPVLNKSANDSKDDYDISGVGF